MYNIHTVQPETRRPMTIRKRKTGLAENKVPHATTGFVISLFIFRHHQMGVPIHGGFPTWMLNGKSC